MEDEVFDFLVPELFEKCSDFGFKSASGAKHFL